MERRGKTIWVLAAVLGLCAAMAFIFSLKLVLDKPRKPQVAKETDGHQEKEPWGPREDLSSSATEESGHVEEGIAVVKKEEFRVVEKLIRDFPGNENPLIIMGEMFRSYGDAVEAIKYYERVLKINPMRP
ncbi:MAG: tetratricopeptide repeat protein, partial [Candidatus Latescibacterota bacterium]